VGAVEKYTKDRFEHRDMPFLSRVLKLDNDIHAFCVGFELSKSVEDIED
jgi:hypothetical protein